MNLIRTLLSVAAGVLIFGSAPAAETTADDGLRYFVITAKPSAAIWDMLVDNPVNPEPAARAFLEGIEGAKLINYFLLAGKPKNLAIVALPDSRDAAAILYQRMATQLVDEIEIFEVIPGDRFAEILQAAKALREKDVYSESDE